MVPPLARVVAAAGWFVSRVMAARARPEPPMDCPKCGKTLHYRRSEGQVEYFECAAGHGAMIVPAGSSARLERPS
jgi:hypothetical protein